MSSFNNNQASFYYGSQRLLINPVTANNPHPPAPTVPYFTSATPLIVDFGTESTNPSSTYSYYDTNQVIPPPPPSPPSAAPTQPTTVGVITSFSIPVTFSVAGITGSPIPDIKLFFGITNPPVIQFTLLSPIGDVYTAVVNGLIDNTDYYFQATASNFLGIESSVVGGPFRTATGGVPPSGPPTVPEPAGITDTTILVSFDVAGITGDAPIIYSALYGLTTDPILPVPLEAIIGTVRQCQITGLTPGTIYYFKSVATNGAGSQISAVSAGITTLIIPPIVTTHYVVNFLTYDGTLWQVNTSGNLNYGSMILTGADAGTIVGTPTQADSIAYLLATRAKTGAKLILSIGGGLQDMTTMMPTTDAAVNICNSIWNVFFGAASDNVLSWSNAAWGGGSTPLFFDGIDLDWEGAMPAGVPEAFTTQWTANVSAYGSAVGAKVLQMAPQSPNACMNTPSASPWTSDNVNIPFPNSSSTLSEISGIFVMSNALIAPAGLLPFTHIFLQCYNSEGFELTIGGTLLNPIFTNVLSQWGYLVMLAIRQGSTVQLTIGFPSNDAGTPLWTNSQEALLNTAIIAANALISDELTARGLGTSVPTDWVGGLGFWSSPSNWPFTEHVYSAASGIAKTSMGSGAFFKETTTMYAWAGASGIDTLWTSSPVIHDERP